MYRGDVEVVKRVALFQGLDSEELSRLQSHLHSKMLPASMKLLNWGNLDEAVYFIVSGSVKIYLPCEGRQDMVLDILGPSEVLGELSAIDQQHHSATVVTLEPTHVFTMEPQMFREELQNIPTLNQNLVRMLVHRMRRLTAHAASLATLDLYGRVAHQLLTFARDYGENTSGGDIKIPIRLSQRDLAGLTGASRERVNEVLSFYKRHNYISLTSGCQIIVHDIDALSRRIQ